MPRGPRIAFENGFFHIYNRGLVKQPIFLEDEDCRKFLQKLEELIVKKKYDFVVYAYCLIPNHFHILLETKKTPLAKIMSSLLTSYSMYFNKKYQRAGHLFQDRYKSKLCDKDTYFLGASRYILLNPIEGGLAGDLINYPWSSYRELFGKSEFKILNKREMEKLIGKSKKDLSKYHDFIMEGVKILPSLANTYTFRKQIEGSPRFNIKIQKQFVRNKIKNRVESLFKIKSN
ncbi:MAG: transposase [Patescibacteria group bacterium]|nr:transposase [Patescibacteria group bacterium]